MKPLWLLPIIGALLGSLAFLLTIVTAGGAPQEAAGYAMAMALAVIPYVLARAIHAMTETSEQLDLKRIATATEKLAQRTD